MNFNNIPENDIAILKVVEEFVYGYTCQPIELFKYLEIIKPDTMATVTGWGATYENVRATVLQVVDVPVISNKICFENYEEIGGYGKFCAGYYGVGQKDACNGDSGSPLVINNRQAGIVSGGGSCGHPYYPGIYTNISYYEKWIYRNIYDGV